MGHVDIRQSFPLQTNRILGPRFQTPLSGDDLTELFTRSNRYSLLSIKLSSGIRETFRIR
jgi:hypothetical protein